MQTSLRRGLYGSATDPSTATAHRLVGNGVWRLRGRPVDAAGNAAGNAPERGRALCLSVVPLSESRTAPTPTGSVGRRNRRRLPGP